MMQPQRSSLHDVCDEAAPTSLYVHIPFCRSRCFYCDFTTYVAPKPEVAGYVECLKKEFELLSEETDIPLQTVFFGGGTPTFLTAGQLETVLTSMRRNFRIEPDAEITIEANPGTVNREKLCVLRDAGVNRISFGAQTFDDNLLMAIGRSHDVPAILQSVELAREAGFKRISLDLMFGLPDQSIASVERAVESALKLGVTHISAYWLKVEPGTPFHRWQTEGLLPLPGEDAEGDMYDRVQTLLPEAGLLQYEVSNFAKTGEEALHNLVYWHNEPYIAAGVGAHGYVRGVRYENVKSLIDYAKALSANYRPIADTHSVTGAESAENTMMLGLRLREGVQRERFLARHGVDVLTLFPDVILGLQRKGLLEVDAHSVRLTDSAWPVANLVFEPFVGALTSD